MTSEFKTITTTRAGLDAALRDMFGDIVERVIPAHKSQNIVFDELRFEIWEDTGRVIGFPALRPFTHRIDTCGTQVVCPEIAREVEVLDHSGLDDQELTTRTQQLVKSFGARVHMVVGNLIAIPFGVYDQDGFEIKRP